MIPLTLRAETDAPEPFVARLGSSRNGAKGEVIEARLLAKDGEQMLFSCSEGMIAIDAPNDAIDGDIVLVDPDRGAADRIIRANSLHNTLLITERCDQLCVMCSQPPKKTHHDRFDIFRQACLAAPMGMVIGVSGGEPTLYKQELLALVEQVLSKRSDLAFHILSNGQHFERDDVERLRQPLYQRVTWGIPLYSASPVDHDAIVAKPGAFERLQQSFAHLLLAGAQIELRTVVMTSTAPQLPALARHIAARLSFIANWSIMQLENIGFARNRWDHLYYDHRADFGPIGEALLGVQLHGIKARLFNFPLCTVPEPFRHLAPASISDWKRKYTNACAPCGARAHCSGFFEWHPDTGLEVMVEPL